MDDPFGTAALRRAVLDAWAASPNRFREDANAEERLSIGYAGRVIAELAANGADAASAAGGEGRIMIRLDGRTLCLANTGAPLSAAGVAALASLRASAKRADPGADAGSVGHFGVGFTAVRAISDEITVVSVSGSVRFSVTETAAALAPLGGDELQAEVLRRDGQLPALRLPWPALGPTPPDGYATEVRLLLRDDVDIASLASTLTADLAADLLWALPGLAEVALPGLGEVRLPAVTVRRRELPDEPGIVELVAADQAGETVQRYRVLRTANELPPELLADRPVEERGRTGWFVTWIAALDEDGAPVPGGPSEVGAPTPTAERIGVPARLVASLPVDEVRSRIAPGPQSDFILERAAVAYADLIRAVPADQRLALIPVPGFPLGEWDARLRERLAAELTRTDLLLDAAGQPLRPAEAVIVAGLSGPAAAAVAEALPGLLSWPAAVAQVEALRGLGVRVGTLDEALGAVAMLDRPTAFYLPLYDALAEMPADDLAGLPLPRSGGGTLIGARGVLLAPAADASSVDTGGVDTGGDDDGEPGTPGVDAVGLDIAGDDDREPATVTIRTGEDGRSAAEPAGMDGDGSATAVPDTSWAAQAARLIPGLRVAAPGLNHPLLRRLGARELDAETLLAAPELARELRRRYDDLDVAEQDDWDDDGAAARDFAALVLGLLAAAGSVPPGSEADLARLLLTDDDGQVYPAGELLLPGAPLRAVLADDADLPTVGADWLDRYGADVLEMVGVRTTFGVARYLLPPGDDADLDAVDLWWRDATQDDGAGNVTLAAELDEGQEFTAITDLDLVADDAWPQALALIAASQPAREALRRTAFGPSYSAWWLRHYAVIGGQAPARWRAAEASELGGLYDPIPLPAALGSDLLAEIGVLTTLLDAATDPAELLARWADGSRTLPGVRVPAVTAAVIDALAAATDDEIPLPATVRVLTGAVIDAEDAAVLDHPALAQVCDPAVLVAGGSDPAKVADLLDLPLASEERHWTVVETSGEATTLGALPGARGAIGYLGRADLAEQPVTVMPDLSAKADGQEIRVAWWVSADGQVHTDGSAAGIARVLAHLADRWPDRHLLQALVVGSGADLAELGIDQ